MKTERLLFNMSIAYILCLALLSPETHHESQSFNAKSLPKIEMESQVTHALELFQRQQTGLLFRLDPDRDLRQFLLNTVRFSLPVKHKALSYEITKSIILEANHHGLDPFFLVAVIRTESEFNLEARGSAGEIGLMQVMPKTAKWMAPQLGISANNLDLRDPATNIRIGAAFFSKLRAKFVGRGSRYVAAYNMGAKNVFRLLKSSQEPLIYPNKVFANYNLLYRDLNRYVVAKQQATRQIASAE